MATSPQIYHSNTIQTFVMFHPHWSLNSGDEIEKWIDSADVKVSQFKIAIGWADDWKYKVNTCIAKEKLESSFRAWSVLC